MAFFGNWQTSNARAGQKTHGFFGNEQPYSNAHAHLKQIKKHSGLIEHTQ